MKHVNALGNLMAVVEDRGGKDAVGKLPGPMPAGKSLDFGTANQIKLIGAPVTGKLLFFASRGRVQSGHEQKYLARTGFRCRFPERDRRIMQASQCAMISFACNESDHQGSCWGQKRSRNDCRYGKHITRTTRAD